MRYKLSALIFITIAVIVMTSPVFSMEITHNCEDQVLEKKIGVTKMLIDNLRAKEEDGEKLQKLIDQKDGWCIALLTKYMSLKRYENLAPVIGDAFDAFKNKNLLFSENDFFSHHLFATLGWLIVNKDNFSASNFDFLIPPIETAAEKLLTMNLKNKYLLILIHQIFRQNQDEFEQRLDEFYDIFFTRMLEEKKDIEKFMVWADDTVFENFPYVMSAKQEYQEKATSLNVILNPLASRVLGHIDLLRSEDFEGACKGFSEIIEILSGYTPVNAFEAFKVDKCVKDVYKKQWFELLLLASKMFIAKNEREAERYYAILDQDFFDNPLFANNTLSRYQAYAPFFFYATGKSEIAKKWMDRAVGQLAFKTLGSVPIVYKNEIVVILAAHYFYELIKEENKKPELEMLYSKIVETSSECVAEPLKTLEKIRQSTQFFNRSFENKKNNLEFEAFQAKTNQHISQNTNPKTPSPQKKKKKKSPTILDVKTTGPLSDEDLKEKGIEDQTSAQKVLHIGELLRNKTPWNLMKALVLNHTTPTMFEEEVEELKNLAIGELSALSPLERRTLFIDAKNMENPMIKSVFDDEFIDQLFPSPITINFPEYTLDEQSTGIFVAGTWYPLRSYDPRSEIYEHTFEIAKGDKGVVWKVKDQGIRKTIFYPLRSTKGEK